MTANYGAKIVHWFSLKATMAKLIDSIIFCGIHVDLNLVINAVDHYYLKIVAVRQTIQIGLVVVLKLD